MANTPARAIVVSHSYILGFKGLCLKFVRTCYGIPSKYSSAALAWKNAKKRHVTKSLRGVPNGAPVFFHIPSNPYGHVAIYLGDGKFRTNYSAKGTIVTADLDDAVFNTMEMLGWTEDLNGVTIKFAKSDSDTNGVLDTAKKVKAWQLSMNKVFPSYAKFTGDGKYEAYSKSVTKEFQGRAGLKQTGNVDQVTAREMRKFGVKA